MTTYGNEKTPRLNKIMSMALIGVFGLLFIALTQPVWRGEQMAQEFTSDCAKRDGVLLTHKKLLGTEYECTSHLGKDYMENQQ